MRSFWDGLYLKGISRKTSDIVGVRRLGKIISVRVNASQL